MLNKFKIIFLAATLLVSSPLFADPLKSVLAQFLVVLETDDEGNATERLEKVEAAAPGSVIEYVLSYRNVSDKSLAGFAIKTPVPANTTYQADTAKASVSSNFRVSIDSGETFETEPVTRTVIENGQAKEIIISPRKYDAISWDVSSVLEAEQTMTMRYRVTIN